MEIRERVVVGGSAWMWGEFRHVWDWGWVYAAGEFGENCPGGGFSSGSECVRQ